MNATAVPPRPEDAIAARDLAEASILGHAGEAPFSSARRVGLAILIALALFAMLGPWLVTADPAGRTYPPASPQSAPRTGSAPTITDARSWRAWPTAPGFPSG